MNTNSIDPNVLYVGEKIDKTLAALSSKLGVGVDHFWPLLVKEQYISGVFSVVLLIGLFLLGILGFIIAFKRHTKNTSYDWDFWFAVGFLGTVVSVLVITMYGVANGSKIANQIYNPEAVALKQLIQSIK